MNTQEKRYVQLHQIETTEQIETVKEETVKKKTDKAEKAKRELEKGVCKVCEGKNKIICMIH